jgi:hypothetical protein
VNRAIIPRTLAPLPELNGVCTHNLNVMARHMLGLVAATNPSGAMTESSVYKDIIDWAWLELDVVEKTLDDQDNEMGRLVRTIRARLQAADSVPDMIALLGGRS